MTLDAILDFIKTNRLAVLATTDEHNKPEAAVVEFGELDDLSIVIDTLKTSRKYKNLQQNNKVAIVIGWDNDKTVQIDALAFELSGDELNVAKEAYFIKNPHAKKWENNPEIAYFALKPKWLRYTDVDKKPWQLEEFTLK